MMIVCALYGLSLIGAGFRFLLAKLLYDLSYLPSKADPGIFMRPSVKSNGLKYYEYVLCYVDDVVCISDNPSAIIFVLQDKFNLKDDKIEESSTHHGDRFT